MGAASWALAAATDLAVGMGLGFLLATARRPHLFREVDAARWDRDGHRWFLTKLIGADNPAGPMLRRYMIFQGDRFGVYVHRFFRPDADRDCHDHPWWFWTLVLWGGYREEYRPEVAWSPCPARVRRFWPGSMHVMPLSSAHRLVSVRPQTWTLLVVGPKSESWGFWVPSDRLTGIQQARRLPLPAQTCDELRWVRHELRWVPWREYGALTADPMDS